MTACQVADGGGLDDGAFNANTYKGLVDAQQLLGVRPLFAETGLVPRDESAAIATFMDEGCDLIVTVGRDLAGATMAAAQANPGQLFAVVDADLFDADAGRDVDLPNVRELLFRMDQAAFLAGYLAAGMTESQKVGAFGGRESPAIADALNSFAAGIRAYNRDSGTRVRLLGWDVPSQHSPMFGDLDEREEAEEVAAGLIAAGADIVLAVAEAASLGAADAAIQADGVLLMGADTDQFVAAPEFGHLWLTSLEKNVDVAVSDAIGSVVRRSFEGGRWFGTLENGGIGLAPFHALDPRVPDELRVRLEQLRAGIVDGSVSVDYEAYA
jgi:basic membrane protein A and related proteins